MILVISNDFFVRFSSNFSVICDFWCVLYVIFLVILYGIFFVISREVYEKKVSELPLVRGDSLPKQASALQDIHSET